MGKNCCGFIEDREANNDPLWRRILWIALILNAVMSVSYTHLTLPTIYSV